MRTFFCKSTFAVLSLALATPVFSSFASAGLPPDFVEKYKQSFHDGSILKKIGLITVGILGAPTCTSEYSAQQLLNVTTYFVYKQSNAELVQAIGSDAAMYVNNDVMTPLLSDYIAGVREKSGSFNVQVEKERFFNDLRNIGATSEQIKESRLLADQINFSDFQNELNRMSVLSDRDICLTFLESQN